MSRGPTVSVVLPVLNGERYVREAIDSVLAQGHESLEVVVDDGGSRDGTREVVRSFGGAVRLVEHGERSLGAALNRGVAESTGEIVGFIDHDDRWTPGRLSRQLAVLESDPTLGCVQGHVRQFHDDLDEQQRDRFAFRHQVLPGHTYGAMLVRREVLDRVGGFDPVHTVVMVAWWSNIRRLGIRCRMLDDVVLERRVHGGNLTLNSGSQTSMYAAALKSALDQRRRRSDA